MKKLFIELFKKGFVVVPDAQRKGFITAAQAHGVHFSGGAYLFEEGAQMFYNDSPKEVRDICAEILRDNSAIVPDSLCWAVGENIRINHREYIGILGAKMLWL